jgi:hypothetical protein
MPKSKKKKNNILILIMWIFLAILFGPLLFILYFYSLSETNQNNDIYLFIKNKFFNIERKFKLVGWKRELIFGFYFLGMLLVLILFGLILFGAALVWYYFLFELCGEIFGFDGPKIFRSIFTFFTT